MISQKINPGLQSLADKALASFVIIQAALKRSQRLSVFVKRPDLNQRMPNFQASNFIPYYRALLKRSFRLDVASVRCLKTFDSWTFDIWTFLHKSARAHHHKASYKSLFESLFFQTNDMHQVTAMCLRAGPHGFRTPRWLGN